MTTTPDTVDTVPPVRRMLPLGLQHVLVMAATPISAVFLISKSFGLDQRTTVDLLAAAFVLSGIGALVQSLGVWKVGVRLPFVMLQGGAPLVVFIAIGKQYDLRVASGAVLIAGVTMVLFLPVFVQLLRFFPTVVLGTLIVVIGVNVIAVAAKLITGAPGTPGFASPKNFGLALVTIAFMVVFWRLLRGSWRQLSVMFGLVAGGALAALTGQFGAIGTGPVFQAPSVFPFGNPVFNIVAALPLVTVALATMAEATGQTVINGEIVGKQIRLKADVPKLIAADALVSLIGGCFGTSLLVTSGENVGLVQVSGVRSRFVTAAAGVLLILIGLFSPVARLINGIPSPVVGGAALVVYAVVSVMGITMLRRVDFSGDHTNIVIAAVALGVGLLPIVVPGAYSHFPAAWQNILGGGVAMTAITAVLLNIVFHHTRLPGSRTAQRLPQVPEQPAPPAKTGATG
ncbi:uracil-xanthine permease family protein [Amycolatopsis benzoatilytica]|uniref:uracil-xanthine permease family protein n=1 Tax=Amycolatopsis benzoatilytica TaxID=346045 RepID=UPI0003651E1A|nr:solute carrier family 23 protein [Amycolatopsis benzoatilytica]